MVVTVGTLRDYEDHPSPIREAMKVRLNGWAPQCGTTKLRSFEVSSCESDTPYKERDIDDSQIQAWFEEVRLDMDSLQPGILTLRQDASAPRATAGKLRLLYGKVDAECFPFSREAFATISMHLDLSLEHISVMNAEHDSVMRCWTDRRDIATPCPSYCTRSAVFYDGGANGYNYANTYLFVHNNPTKRWTHALLLQSEFIPHPEYLKCQPPYLESIIDYLRTHVHLVGYDPFFAATTLCKAALPLHQKMIIILSSRISSLDGRLNSLGSDVDPLELDFMGETTKIQSHTQQLSILREMIERQLLVLQRIVDDKKTRKYQKTLRRNDSDKIEKVRQDVLDDVEMVAEGVATDNHALLKWIDRELLTVKSLSIMVRFPLLLQASQRAFYANAVNRSITTWLSRKPESPARLPKPHGETAQL